MVITSHTILLIEDSHEDFEATTRVLRKSGLANPIVHCADGDDALEFLHQRGHHADALTPGVVLLDLNLPGTDGREILAEIKNSERLRSIPVIVLSTSADERDIERCFQAGANSYLQKPVDLLRFLQATQPLTEYAFEILLDSSFALEREAKGKGESVDEDVVLYRTRSGLTHSVEARSVSEGSS